MKDKEKEIRAVENIIRLLNSCLVIHLRNADLKSVKATIIDIQKCKRELKKLIVAEDAETEKVKNGAVQ